jgi:hypothetical protein
MAKRIQRVADKVMSREDVVQGSGAMDSFRWDEASGNSISSPKSVSHSSTICYYLLAAMKCFPIAVQNRPSLDNNVSQSMYKQIGDAKLMLRSNLSQHQHRRMARDATGRSSRYTASYQADSTYACMHATKQSGDGTSAEHESGRTCEESAHSLGRASHEKPLCTHARRSRVQLRLYCTCRCSLNLPQALFHQAAPVGSVI